MQASGYWEVARRRPGARQLDRALRAIADQARPSYTPAKRTPTVFTREQKSMVPRSTVLCRFLAAGTLLCGLLSGCGGTNNALRNNLNAMQTDDIRIKGQVFHVWLALTEYERERGLMQVTEAELAPQNGVERGMLFSFPDEDNLAFWMYNTIIPLDIAYINSDGVIVQTYTMAPLETRVYPSVEPAQFALEVRSGLLQSLGIAAGDFVELPDSMLKGSP